MIKTNTLTKAVIVEDDPAHLADLQKTLKESFPHIQVTGMAANVADACNLIARTRPDLVFLDIDPEKGENGFDILKRIDDPAFSIIFTTQHNTLGNVTDALRISALDFLVKPVDQQELQNALRKFDKVADLKKLQALKDFLDGRKLTKIPINQLRETIYLAVDNIMYVEASDVYSHFHLHQPEEGKVTYISSVLLKNWESMLLHYDFKRVHHSFLVNKLHVVKMISKPDGSWKILLKNRKEIPVSRSRKQEVKDWLKG